MRVLAFDLGTKTGWAYYDSDLVVDMNEANKVVTSGAYDISSKRIENVGYKFIRFKRFVHDLIQAYLPQKIVFEEVRFHSMKATDAAHLYGALQSILLMACDGHYKPIPYEGIPPATAKKFITGKGNADKNAVVNAIRSLGFKPKSHDESDAIAVLLTEIYKDNTPCIKPTQHKRSRKSNG